jgi:hypothetical protein
MLSKENKFIFTNKTRLNKMKIFIQIMAVTLKMGKPRNKVKIKVMKRFRTGETESPPMACQYRINQPLNDDAVTMVTNTHSLR